MVKKKWFQYILHSITVLGLLVFLFPLPTFAICPTTLTLTITSSSQAPVGNTDAAAGPLVTAITAVLKNTGANTAQNVYVHIGNGTTPGTFNAGTDGGTLSLLGGATDATRFIVDLAPGQSKSIFWMTTYPHGAKFSDYGAQTYPFTVWANNEAGCAVVAASNLTTTEALKAAANKLLGTITWDPPSGVVNPGNILTVKVADFDLGQIGANEDVFLQPIGNLSFNPNCFRLIKTEVYIPGLSFLWPMPVYDQLYFPNIIPKGNYSNPGDYVKYYFVAEGPCTTTILPYNVVASGTQEKYPKDYGATVTVTSNSGGLGFSKSVSPTTAHAGDTLTWTITYTNNTAYPMGDPDTGNGLVVLDEAIPINTTYVAGSATCTGYSCIKLFSIDNGTTWTAIEPPPASITKIKWYINAVIPPSGSGTVQFQTTVNPGTPNCTQICNTARASIDDGSTLVSSTVCTNNTSPTVSLSGDLDFCFDSSTLITATPSGGASPYDYAWSGTATGTDNLNGTFTATSSGTVHVTATDDAGCTAEDEVTVSEDQPLDCTITAPSPVCANSTGHNAQVPDAGPGASYTWTLTNGSITGGSGTRQITWSAATASPVNIKIDITNGNGCTCSSNVDVTVNPLPNSTASSNSPVCIGDTIQLTGGPAGMSYSWTGPNGWTSNVKNPTIPNATAAMSGTYTLTVTNGNGCSKNATTSVSVVQCGGGGGGGEPILVTPGVVTCPLTLTVNMLGKITTATMTSDGVLCEDCLAFDPPNQNSWEAKAGTKLTLVDNRVPKLIKVTLAGSSPPAGTAETIGNTYEINAYASLDSTIAYAINIDPLFFMSSAYDPNVLPKNTSEVIFAYYPNPNQGWSAMGSEGAVAEIGKARGTLNSFIPNTLLVKLAETAPAKFAASNLTVSPAQVQPNQQITISIDVANTGGTSGEYTVELKVDGIVKSSKQITLDAGASQTVSFSVTEDAVGRYQVEIAGLSGEFVVAAPTTGFNWWLIVGIIAAIILALAIWLTMRQRST